MRMAVGLEDGLGLDGDRCMRDTPTIIYCTGSQNVDIPKLVISMRTQSKRKLYMAND